MSRNKGLRAADWVAEYLRPWWPGCEATPNSRKGRDLLGTPPCVIEVKTGVEWRAKWLAQVLGYVLDGEFGFVVYLPPGCGERQVADALAIVPLRALMPVLVDAGFAPAPADTAEGGLRDGAARDLYQADRGLLPRPQVRRHDRAALAGGARR